MAGGENSFARSADCGCVVCEDGGGGVVQGAHPAGAAPERDRDRITLHCPFIAD